MNAARHLAPPCEIRLGKPDDLAFVVDCWTKYEARSSRGRRFRDSTSHVRALLARDGSRLLVAHVPGEPDSILGWAATEDGVAGPERVPACIHYVYVRKDARRLGVASALIGERDVRLEYSHALPLGIVVPATWTLNVKRAET